MDAAQIRALLAEIGPLLDLDQVSAFDDQDAWAVVADGLEVTFELDAERRVLVILGAAGRPAEETRARVHGALLQYNFAWRDTGGMRMALDGPDGDVVLIYDLATEGLDSVRLGTVVREFIALLRDWQALIASGPVTSGAGAAEGPGIDPTFMSGAIRA